MIYGNDAKYASYLQQITNSTSKPQHNFPVFIDKGTSLMIDQNNTYLKVLDSSSNEYTIFPNNDSSGAHPHKYIHYYKITTGQELIY